MADNVFTILATSSDPHMEGFDGDKFDFMGEHGKIFNMLSAGHVQVNGRIRGISGSMDWTFFDRIYIKVGDEAVGFSHFHMGLEQNFFKPAVAFMNDDQILQSKTFPTGLFDQNGDEVQGRVEMTQNDMIVDVGAYKIIVTRVETEYDLEVPHINMKIEIGELGILCDGVYPHGVVGQTADFDGIPKFGFGKQGEGVIEGVYTDYEVSGGFADDFKFNRFGTRPTTEARYGDYRLKKSVGML